jgi:rhomboid family GlyGly-CTERM serine protease
MAGHHNKYFVTLFITRPPRLGLDTYLMPAFLKLHGFPLAVGLAAIIVALLGTEADLALRYDRAAILDGQAWRLLSGHMAHLGWSHLAMNLAALALIWILVGQLLSPVQWVWAAFVTALGIGGGLLAFNPELAWYVGLSGVLHGFLVSGCLADLRSGHRSAWLLLALVWAKLIWEQIAGPLPGSALGAGGAVVVDAHLYGALAGILAFAVLKRKKT